MDSLNKEELEIKLLIFFLISQKELLTKNIKNEI